jgi:anti-sigma factor RsiW
MNHCNPFGPCEDFQFEIAELVDGALRPDRAVQVMQHLAACPRCHEWRDELSAFDTALASALPRPQLSAGFDAGLQSRLQELEAVKRKAAVAARLAADSEYECMRAMLNGWGWRAALNGIAAGAVMAGAVFALRALAPEIAQNVGPKSMELIPALSLAAAVTVGVTLTSRVRRLGLAALSPLLG